MLDSELRSIGGNLRALILWNTESTGSLHDALQAEHGDGYISSEYLGSDHQSGDEVWGVRHEDICDSSFATGSIDVVVCGDVLEHVPQPEKALYEIARVLKPGGRLVFTVPFVEGMARSEVRARIDRDGNIEHVKPPVYHGDPIRPGEGALVYTVFGEDIRDFAESAGFELRRVILSKPELGIIGGRSPVFVAEKTAGP